MDHLSPGMLFFWCGQKIGYSEMDIAERNLTTEILAFVKGRTPRPRPAEITVDTDLRADMRMIWEDAETFMAAFFARFEVNQGDFDLQWYFPDEGTPLTNAFAARLGRRRPPINARPLTIKMLGQAARIGFWDTESVES